ncbi:HRDC-like protein [Fimicolochytrium jonesii]|uniref:HRDC-like protein n=1 Tax=Fimicolochytrium jonesii TaxID=1396493 RepID=UPI0022FF4176|nr:HRDC-like protein [Fimicolochytrium jonesii]KAI8826588.1 HRDC-like protein [Fimicolochytrium jonesii]
MATDAENGTAPNGTTYGNEGIPSIYQPPRRLIPPRVRQAEDEIDASRAKLGADFDGADCLLIPEVSALLERQRDEQMQSGIERPHNEILSKTIAYCARFGNVNDSNTVRHMKHAYDNSRYYPFEGALLANLNIETVEEARALVPSLDRDDLDDNTLLATILELQELRKFQSSSV